MSTNNQNKNTRQVRVAQLVAGIQKHFASLPSITLGNASYTPAALIERLQSALSAIKQTSNAKAAWLTKVQNERNTLSELSRVLRYIKSFVIAQFGDTQDSSDVLEAFGFTPRKARPKNVALKAQAAVKVRATRVARSTKGKKQKANIKGTPAAQPPKGGTAATDPAPAANTAPAPIKPAS